MKTSIVLDRGAAGVALAMLLLALVLFVAPAFGQVAVPEAVRKACESLTQADFQKYHRGKEYVKKIQRGLMENFGDSVGSWGPDGFIGNDTTEALKKFCLHSMLRSVERGERLADLVMATLLQYSAIADEFPNDWKSIASVAVTKGGEVEEVFRVGDTAPICTLPLPPTPLPGPLPCPPDEDSVPEPWINEGYAVSYQLVESDLKALQDLGKQNLLIKLEGALKGKTFADKPAFIDQVKRIVRAYAPPTEAQVEETSVYQLAAQSLDKSMLRAMPDAILNNLTKLQGVAYGSRQELREAVDKVVTDVANKDVSVIVQSAEEKTTEIKPQPKEKETPLGSIEKSVVPLLGSAVPEVAVGEALIDAADKVVKDVTNKDGAGAKGMPAAPPPKTTFSLTEKSFVTLLGSDIPEVVLNKLEAQKDKAFDSEAKLVQAVRTAVTSVTDQYQSAIAAFIEEARSYALTEAYLKPLKAKLATGRIPEIVLSMLEQDLKAVEYPNRELFESAVHAKLYQFFEMAIVDSAQANSPLQLTDGSFKKLEAQKMPEAILNALKSLQGQTFADEQALKQALETIGIDQVVRQYASDALPLIVDQARKEHAFPVDTSLRWEGRSNGGLCGCVLDDLAGIVYGFYPFWFADDEKPAPGEKKTAGQNGAGLTQAGGSVQFIDFSVVSRIGFYAVSFDDQGEINETGNRLVEQARFVEEARRYRTKMDVVVFKQDWEGWFKMLGNGWSAVADRLVTRIVDLIDLPLMDFRSRMVPYISFGGASVPTLADGVTINFDGVPQAGEDNVAKFVTFVRRLKQRMMATHLEKPLNVMLMMPLQDAVQVIKEIETAPGKIEIPVHAASGRLENDLVDKVVRRKVAVKAVDHYLVFLAEPTTDSKKDLRLFIEEAFKGDQRRKVLRRIIPVITPDGHARQQLEDDLIYLKDNFAGVGLWPLPLKNRFADKQANAVTDRIASAVDAGLGVSFLRNPEFYEAASGGGLPAMVCKTVCPNRWAFRIVGDVFLMILLAAILAYWFICRVQLVFWKYFPLLVFVVVLAVLWWFLILYCDPYYEWLRTGNLPLIVVVAGLIAFSIMRYLSKKKQREVP